MSHIELHFMWYDCVAMHFIYYINKLTATKVDSTYLGCLYNQRIHVCPVAGLERMTTGSVVSALSYHATQVVIIIIIYTTSLLCY